MILNKDYVGRRALVYHVKVYSAHSQLMEVAILEVSPSGLYAKLMDLHGKKYWKDIKELTLVELLPQPEPRPQD